MKNDIAVRVLWHDDPSTHCWLCGDTGGRYAYVRAYNDGFRLDALSVLICPACYAIMANALVDGGPKMMSAEG